MSIVLTGAAPESVTMKQFCKTLGKILKRPSFFYVPAFVLQLIFGEGAGVLVKSARVKP